jgi:RNA polymerase sigma-70 factor (ECF subfamily)
VPEVLVRVITGRADVVAEAYDLHQRDLHAFAYAIVRDREEADDLVQETFMRYVREVGAGRPPERIRAWLFAVCTNLARSRGRRRAVAQRWLHRLGRSADESMENAESTVLRRESHEELGRVMGALPAEQRTVLMLAAQGFGGEEIASLIGRSHGATRTLLWRARITVRERLGDRVR